MSDHTATAAPVPGSRSPRSLLFVPGSRPDRFGSALRSGADLVVFDLEDAVAPEDKARGRDEVLIALQRADAAGLGRCVRVNALDTPDGAADTAALVAAGLPVTVMVPKADSASALTALHRGLPAGSSVLALIETAGGVYAVRDIATAEGVALLVFGHLDLCAELGLDPDDDAVLGPIRLELVLAAAAAGLPSPVDGVTTDFRDPDRVAADVRRAARRGMYAKLCIHPAQVPVAHEALRPSAEDVTWAREVVAAAQGGAVGVRGRMVDRPVLLRAVSVLSRAGT